MRMKTDFHDKDFALSLTLKWRLRWTRKRPISRIGHFGKYHNTLCLSPQILHKHCFQFLLGLTMVPRENKNNASAKFGGTNKEYYVIYQTRGRVFHQISKHWEVGWKNEMQPSSFIQLRRVWISDETLFRVFDIASQSIDNSWRKSKQSFSAFDDN